MTPIVAPNPWSIKAHTNRNDLISTGHCCHPCFLQKMSLEQDPGCGLSSGPSGPPTGPLATRQHTWLAHALLDTFQLSGGQGAGLLHKAAASLLSQLPEAGSGPGAGLPLHTDRHFLEAVSETEIVTDSILPAFWSRPEKGEVPSVGREEA